MNARTDLTAKPVGNTSKIITAHPAADLATNSAVDLTTYYDSPIGTLTLVSDGSALIGVWMKAQKYFAATVAGELVEKPDDSVLVATAQWLDAYFSHGRPAISELPLAPRGGEFRQQVWDILRTIPYGQTKTYGEIAQQIATQQNKEKMSSQAVGGAVGHNPISIIVPCHRVVGANGSLTGYAGGLDKKIALLKHEGVDMSQLFVPSKGTAL